MLTEQDKKAIDACVTSPNSVWEGIKSIITAEKYTWYLESLAQVRIMPNIAERKAKWDAMDAAMRNKYMETDAYDEDLNKVLQQVAAVLGDIDPEEFPIGSFIGNWRKNKTKTILRQTAFKAAVAFRFTKDETKQLLFTVLEENEQMDFNPRLPNEMIYAYAIICGVPQTLNSKKSDEKEVSYESLQGMLYEAQQKYLVNLFGNSDSKYFDDLILVAEDSFNLLDSLNMTRSAFSLSIVKFFWENKVSAEEAGLILRFLMREDVFSPKSVALLFPIIIEKSSLERNGINAILASLVIGGGIKTNKIKDAFVESLGINLSSECAVELFKPFEYKGKAKVILTLKDTKEYLTTLKHAKIISENAGKKLIEELQDLSWEIINVILKNSKLAKESQKAVFDLLVAKEMINGAAFVNAQGNILVSDSSGFQDKAEGVFNTFRGLAKEKIDCVIEELEEHISSLENNEILSEDEKKELLNEFKKIKTKLKKAAPETDENDSSENADKKVGPETDKNESSENAGKLESKSQKDKAKQMTAFMPDSSITQSLYENTYGSDIFEQIHTPNFSTATRDRGAYLTMFRLAERYLNAAIEKAIKTDTVLYKRLLDFVTDAQNFVNNTQKSTLSPIDFLPLIGCSGFGDNDEVYSAIRNILISKFIEEAKPRTGNEEEDKEKDNTEIESGGQKGKRSSDYHVTNIYQIINKEQGWYFVFFWEMMIEGIKHLRAFTERKILFFWYVYTEMNRILMYPYYDPNGICMRVITHYKDKRKIITHNDSKSKNGGVSECDEKLYDVYTYTLEKIEYFIEDAEYGVSPSELISGLVDDVHCYEYFNQVFISHGKNKFVKKLHDEGVLKSLGVTGNDQPDYLRTFYSEKIFSKQYWDRSIPYKRKDILKLAFWNWVNKADNLKKKKLSRKRAFMTYFDKLVKEYRMCCAESNTNNSLDNFLLLCLEADEPIGFLKEAIGYSKKLEGIF